MKSSAFIASSALLSLAATPALAGDRPVAGALRLPVPPTSHFSWERGHGFGHGVHRGLHGGFGGVWIIERPVPVVIEREVVVREAPPPPAAVPLPQKSGGGDKRKPYVVGKSYAELPDGCLKLIEGGDSYYLCGGEWYRQVGGKYVAVARKL